MKVYEVEIGGVVHTMQFPEEEAKSRGLKPAEDKAADKPNKARTPKNKEA